MIPAVELRNAKLATVYLGTFCLTSTFVGGGFASFYGWLSDWLAGGPARSKDSTEKRQPEGIAGRNRVFMIEVGSALLSICVGVIWLILLGLGKLDAVFP